ncbi:DNA methyltransferase [Pseudarcicella hirudinis]|uniref:DNA methyltransferase n=1 Tax=Pseudarcicella hirudinis TaxID=1079859 RepID=UPI0035EB234E
MTFEIKHGDNIEILKYYPNNHFDSIVTDAPYGLGREQDPEKVLKEWLTHGYYEIKGKGFMGKAWDAFVPQPVFWKECIRVLKPGGHLLCFFGTRTYDWGTLAIRLAGFQIRDMITWHYGSGFPKSVNCGDGKGTALKPASEPICVARKPLEGTIYQNFKKYGIGVLNIDNCRIEFKSEDNIQPDDLGRFPANVIFDEYTSCILDEQSGILTSGKPQGIRKASNKIYGQYSPGLEITGYGDTGGASRFSIVQKPLNQKEMQVLKLLKTFIRQ